MSAAQHDIFVIDRVLDAPVALVFQAWADRDAKARWFHGGGEWTETTREQDFRVGGRDRLAGRRADATTDYDARYLDIVPNERIVYVYVMHLNGTKISISLATVEFHPEGKRTRLSVTEQGAFINGYEDKGSRKHGIGVQMDALAESLLS